MRFGQTRLEWALFGVIAIVCAVLSFLQYRWTGELNRAERVRLRAGVDEQVRRLVRAFDDEIREPVTNLVPTPADLRTAGSDEAHRVRYQRWFPSHDRNLFGRIAVARPEQGALNLYELGPEGRLTPISWPADWEPFHVNMTARMKRLAPPPATPTDTTLIERPVLDDTNLGAERPAELEWMIFELKEEYVRNRLLPRLVSEYLNPPGEPAYDVSVTWAGPREHIIFSTRRDKTNVAPGADATAGIFSANNGLVAGRRPDWFRPSPPLSRWVIAVRHREGSLEAVVARAQKRNLITSLLLIALLGGTAWALVRYTARSRRLAEMQFRFAAGVSHDLRTPLTVIRCAAFNLTEGIVKEPAAISRYAELILRNSEELTSMIENVLAFSATLHRNTGAHREPFAVGDLVEHAATAMATEIELAGCRIEVNVAPGLPTVSGDPASLELAFRNLIGNAVRYAAAGKWIGVSAAPATDGVEVRICDRGPGIPEAEQTRIFEPFYRGEQTRGIQVRGTGLGLSLVKDAIERHHGTISVHNSPGGGAQFTVRLPAMPEAA